MIYKCKAGECGQRTKLGICTERIDCYKVKLVKKIHFLRFHTKSRTIIGLISNRWENVWIHNRHTVNMVCNEQRWETFLTESTNVLNNNKINNSYNQAVKTKIMTWFHKQNGSFIEQPQICCFFLLLFLFLCQSSDGTRSELLWDYFICLVI